MICTYCGKDRGNEYFCLNCRSPKEIIDNGRLITKEHVEEDVARLIEYCQEMLYPEDYKYTHRIQEAAAMLGIAGSISYYKIVSKLAKEVLEMQSLAGATFEPKLSK